MLTLRFVAGTLELHGLAAELPSEELPPKVRWDARARCYRAAAMDYAAIVLDLHRRKVEYEDEARRYTELDAGLLVRKEPRPYQAEAIEAWKRGRGHGVVVLPTGAGKSYVAMMAIDAKRRSTLIVAPTLDLVRQWYDNLRTSFGRPVGIVGGGDHRIEDLTVTTYDSAYLQMENFGSRFGMIVFDEAHHLPGETYALAAQQCIAPYRLGLTATPERSDGREQLLDELIGPLAYRQEIVEMSGDYLADYETVRVAIDLSPEDRERYEHARALYRGYVQAMGIRLGSPSGWSEFIRLSATSDQGRQAMQAFREHRAIAFAAPAKLEYVEYLLHQHRDDRAILFTQDNATAYEISRRFLIPTITHQTKVSERSEILSGLAEGRYRAVVTSKVLNEGVDVPDANVAIIVSGSGSVREHVQRLGRVLRKKGDKRAILYELVTTGTTEAFTSERRRDHVAYR